MITLYHLGISQSDRIVWLLEELELPSELEWFDRGANGLAQATGHHEAMRVAGFAQEREKRFLAHLEQRLGECPWFAGPAAKRPPGGRLVRRA